VSINQFLKQIGQGDQIKDYQHASKLYVGDNFNLAPRQGYLFHVFLDLAPAFLNKIGDDSRVKAGMLVKSVDLPKFSVDTKTLNSYNKYNIVQTKVKYDPITITFHDDHADVVRSIWFQYYNHYYRDADLGYSDGGGQVNPAYMQETKYGQRTNNNWGYTPRSDVGRLINAIRIYSMSQKRFAEYTLVNPVITSFKHGQHQSGSGDPIQHEMTISYESVLYGAGWVSDQTVRGFAGAIYDHSPSPLTPAGGGTQSIIGPGGLLATADSIVGDLSKTPPAESNPGAAFFKAFRGYQNLKNMDLGAVAKTELTQVGMDMLRGNNPLNRIFVPNAGNLANGTPIYEYGKGATPGNGAGGANSVNGITSNGTGIGSSSGLAMAGTVLAGLGASVLVSSRAGGGISGLLAVGGLVTGAGALNKLIKINPFTGAAESVSTLPDKTSAEAKLAAIPGASVNAQLNNTLASATTSTQDAVSGATDSAMSNPTFFENNGSVSTSTNPVPTAVASFDEFGTPINTPIIQTASESAAQTVADATAIAEQDPSFSMNNVGSLDLPTDQGDVGA
jgi:hypothetical protein